MTMQDWRHRALCRDTDPELYFPTAVEGSAAYAEQAEAALAVCRACPVLEQCRGFALAVLPDGIAGGMTPEQRRAARAGQAKRSAVRPPVPELERGASPSPAPAQVRALLAAHGNGGRLPPGQVSSSTTRYLLQYGWVRRDGSEVSGSGRLRHVHRLTTTGEALAELLEQVGAYRALERV
jgi:hypothetical protein